VRGLGRLRSVIWPDGDKRPTCTWGCERLVLRGDSAAPHGNRSQVYAPKVVQRARCSEDPKKQTQLTGSRFSDGRLQLATNRHDRRVKERSE